ncbi:TetR/AcrR family transcriptional regulator [Thermohalobacter berrensis]|uniref:HTH tetR-type domain-containing protein n=1 Tax=Thermohalobacter berrensis TaxID=99594 RepID=A0A419SZD4_9FIRM|nr:TetR/AcrR family transcriptional regulator [Thermohalobacter berrensis]RKD30508.1 hypothetical protein BET03_04000 [Thermohalobacter berrensis]
MDKKEIQRQRRRKYFIDAAKHILKTKGIDDITVRKVAELAGYSYGTIYNYFKDLNELLWYVVGEIFQDILQFIDNNLDDNNKALEGMKNAYRLYTSYFIDNPNFYRLLFFSQLGKPPEEIEEKIRKPIFAQRQIKLLKQCADEGLIKEEDIERISEILTGMVHGLMLFHFSNKELLSEEEFFKKIEDNIDFILNSKE